MQTIRKFLFCATGLWTAVGIGTCQVNQVEPLTQRVEVSRQRFVLRYPAAWSYTEAANIGWLANVPIERQKSMSKTDLDRAAQIIISTENRRNHADAVRRLRDVQAETDSPSTFLKISGWPALQRSYIGSREQGGDDDKDGRPQKIMRVTTAIAAGNQLIRLEGRLPPDAPATLVTQVKTIGASAAIPIRAPAAQVDREVQSLRSQRPPQPTPAPAPRPPSGPGASTPASARPQTARLSAPMIPTPLSTPGVVVEAAGLAQRVNFGNVTIASEAEIAVSANGHDIVIAQARNYATSNDGGLTFPTRGTFPSTGGDASLAFGRSGNFYEATINNTSTGINFSIDKGKTFNPATNAFTCGTTFGTPTFCPGGAPVPDQEHIAADRFNAGTGGDQVYSVWRQLNGTYGIVCSSDSGQNWTAAAFTSPGDLPRVTVGRDGFVYVVYQNGNILAINKYSSCNSGLVVQSANFPQTLATIGGLPGTAPNWVTCPMPGLDRCNNGNNLSSFTVAVDDTNANHVYVAYAQTTSATAPINESIVIRDSTDGGVTWPAARAVTVSSASTARRFMPWLCSVGGAAYATWYDRRAATAASNDLTDYYAASASVSGGAIVPGVEFQVNAPGSADAECASGWPCLPRSPADAQSCSVPQVVGLTCQHSPPNPTDSKKPCDVSGTVCPASEFCTGGGGCPKYGDYNGNACSAGRLYGVWASATAPPGQPKTGNIDLYFAAKVVCCTPQMQVPASVSFPTTCSGSAATATVNVCNTGKADLNVNPITSSNAEFSVGTPSSGYPVTIGQGACFPFQVTFTPSGSGLQTGILTVPSDDPVNPTVTIPVKGTAGTPGIATLIANGADFGEVCPGSFRDLPLTINNNGACNLSVFAISSSSPDFGTASVVSFPLTIAPGTSLPVPIGFQPSSAGAKTGNITLVSNDPARPSAAVAVRGLGGQPTIATVVADSGDFGSVCAGTFRDLAITISNSGTCPLKISNIASSSPEFKTAQVLSYPLTIAPGSSIQIPIRYQPTSAGNKTATITISNDDPAAPAKTVTLTAKTDPAYICHPPIYVSLGMAIGPTFGTSRTGDFTFSGKGRFLAPLTARGTFSAQAEGEYMYYGGGSRPGRREGEFDGGLLDRLGKLQVGLFGSFKHANLQQFSSGGGLGQAVFTFDYLFPHARLGAFATKGFKDNATLNPIQSGSLTLPSISPGLTQILLLPSSIKIVDQIGVSGEAPITGRTWLEGDVEYLRRHAPGLSDRAGFNLRIMHSLTRQFAVTGEVGVNESYLGRNNNGRVVFGLQFGHFVRPRDFVDKRHPAGTTIPRLHYEVIP